MFKRMMESVDRALGRGVIDEDLYEELEEALLQADTNIRTSQSIIANLSTAIREEKISTPEGIRDRLQEEIRKRFDQKAESALYRHIENPTVYLFVGVNGVGKTTTIGKLAYQLSQQGRSVLLAAGDTFRAAAIEQLEIWAERAGVDIVRAQSGSDSAATIYDAIEAGKARGVDYVIADTAGRQHTKGALMNELNKVARSAEKALGRKPDEVLLVLDANTGQNALRQAEEFIQAAGVTGLVLTKLEGTARGGALIGVHEQFGLPIKLIGVGEKIEDLREFDADAFAAQLFG